MRPLHIYTDGGRSLAGFKGMAGDCVTRAIAIAAQLPYRQVYDELAALQASMRRTKRRKMAGIASASGGVYVQSKLFKDYMADLGFVWTPTMSIGSGCKVHLRHGELPRTGRLVVALSRHYAAVIDGVLFDNHDCSRDGMRCVYGYWTLQP